MRRPAALRVPAFGRLLTSYSVNEIGDSVGLVALSVLVFERTEAPLAIAAFFFAARFLPALLSPVLVARVDQIGVRRVLPALYVAEAVVFVALALQVDAFSLPVVLGLGLLDGTLALAGRSLSRGAVAAVLTPAGLLRDGNAMLNIAFGAASVAGLAAGGIIVSAASLEVALLVDAASFLAIAVLLAATPALPAGAPPLERQTFAARLRSGLAFARRQPLIRGLLVWQAAALVFLTSIIPVEVVYAKETLETTDAGFGVFLATWSGGIVAGGLLFVRLRNRGLVTLVVVSTALVGLAYVGMGLVRSLGPACAFAVLGGLGNGIQWVSVMTLLQESTPADLQARVAGLLESTGAAMPGLGYLLGGVVAAVASPPAAFLIAGAGVLVLAVIGVLLPRPDAPPPPPPEAPDGRGAPVAI